MEVVSGQTLPQGRALARVDFTASWLARGAPTFIEKFVSSLKLNIHLYTHQFFANNGTGINVGISQLDPSGAAGFEESAMSRRVAERAIDEPLQII